jgi:serine/threonine protein kinase
MPILDFGLAKIESNQAPSGDTATTTLKEDRSHLTSPGTTLGTVAYMSPEQVRGEELDRRSDLFSFGAVLYEMATGALAFQGESTGLMYNAILKRAPITAARIHPGISAELDRIIGKRLEKDKNLRYQKCGGYSGGPAAVEEGYGVADRRKGCKQELRKRINRRRLVRWEAEQISASILSDGSRIEFLRTTSGKFLRRYRLTKREP